MHAYNIIMMMLNFRLPNLNPTKYQMRATPPNFMLTKIIHYTVHKINNPIMWRGIILAVAHIGWLIHISPMVKEYLDNFQTSPFTCTIKTSCCAL